MEPEVVKVVNKLTKEERVERAGEIHCMICETPWNGHIVLDDKIGFQMYCAMCDLFIWTEDEFKIFITLGNNGKALCGEPDKLQTKLTIHAKSYGELPKTHPRILDSERIMRKRNGNR